MDVTIVKEDRAVMVDGKGINFDFDLAANIWAIQWDGATGEVEFNDGTPNEVISDFAPYQYLVDGYHAEMQRAENEQAQAELDRIANMTYADKRREAYPALEDQLDDIFHNGIAGWHTSIQAVKDKYPK